LCDLQVKEAKINKFEIPDKEIAALEMDKEDIENELQTCKKYLDSAEEMLSKLKEDITSETWKFGVKVVGASAGVAAVVAVGGGKLIILSFWFTSFYSNNFIDDVNIRLQYVQKIFIRSTELINTDWENNQRMHDHHNYRCILLSENFLMSLN